jgi:hypothetical protein
MTVDYSEWVAAQEAKAAAQAPALAAHRRTLQMVAVKLEDLEHADAWGVYTALLQGRVTVAEASLASLREQMEDYVGEPLLRAQLELKRLKGLLEAYRDALALPAQVQKQLTAETVVR